MIFQKNNKEVRKMDPNTVIIRNARPDDDGNRVASLIMLSAKEYFPFVYGSRIEKAIAEMFVEEGNIFSCNNIIVAETDGEIVAAAMCFEKAQDNLINTLAFLKHCFRGIISHPRRTLKCTSQIANFDADEYYLSNVAVDSKLRGLGIFSLIQERIERDAKKRGFKKVSLDVETNKADTVATYLRCGYDIIKIINLSPFPFRFYRMRKELE